MGISICSEILSAVGRGTCGTSLSTCHRLLKLFNACNMLLASLTLPLSSRWTRSPQISFIEISLLLTYIKLLFDDLLRKCSFTFLLLLSISLPFLRIISPVTMMDSTPSIRAVSPMLEYLICYLLRRARIVV